MSRHQRVITMVPGAFKVLPPLSPEIPPPPRAPESHRVAAPVAAPRREATAFVILHDERPPPSRGASPSNGRVSPFRGRGFREESTIRYSREPSPAEAGTKENLPRSRSKSRSRLPVATSRIQNGSSTPSSPVRGSPSGVPKAARRNSLSPNRATKVLNQVNRNKNFTPPATQRKLSFKNDNQKTAASPKRVGPINKTNNVSKPPLPKSNQNAQKENEKSNLTSPYKKRSQPNKPDVTKSPSRIPRTRSVSKGRGANVRPTSPSPVGAVIRKSNRIPLKPQSVEKKNLTNTMYGEKKNGTATVNGVKKIIPNNGKTNEPNNVKNNNSEFLIKVGGTAMEEVKKPILDFQDKIPTPVEAVVSTVPGSDAKTPEIEKREIHEPPVETSQPKPHVQSPPPSKVPSEDESKPYENEALDSPKAVSEVKATEDDPEPKVTLVRTTTIPAMELAQPDVIPTILSKGEQEISQSISEAPSVEDKSENPREALASVESVRSTTSIETVRAVARDGEVLDANNLIKAEGNGRTIAWDNKTPDMTLMNNSVHPMEPTLPLQPPKKKGCCGRLTDRLCCCPKAPACCGKVNSRISAFCSKLNCCKKISCSCCKKPTAASKPKAAPKPPKGQTRGRVREMLSRLNCLRWSRCCKRQSQPRPQAEDGERTGCCAGCGKGSKKCYSALFCLNLACCERLRDCCRCNRFQCCGMGGCCGPTPPQLDRRKSRMSVRKSQTSITQGLPKLDASLVEHQVPMMRGAVPVLPVCLAWLCCILNVFLPGLGTLLSGFFCLCFGKPRFSVNDSYISRLGACCINIVVAVSQLFTVLFCLVGWGWSIWWGVMMVKLARKQKRISLAEKTASDGPAPVAVNQNHDVERAR